MCCASKEWPIDMKPDGICSECGQPTYDGEAWESCSWSPKECETCGNSPCDGSC